MRCVLLRDTKLANNITLSFEGCFRRKGSICWGWKEEHKTLQFSGLSWKSRICPTSVYLGLSWSNHLSCEASCPKSKPHIRPQRPLKRRAHWPCRWTILLQYEPDHSLWWLCAHWNIVELIGLGRLRSPIWTMSWSYWGCRIVANWVLQHLINSFCFKGCIKLKPVSTSIEGVGI